MSHPPRAAPKPELHALDFSAEAREGALLESHAKLARPPEEPGAAAPPPATPTHKPPPLGGAADMTRTEAKRTVRRREDIVGTPEYLAPEILLGIEHGVGVDWWALGVILFEFLVGLPPFTGDTPELVFERILSAPIPWHMADEADPPLSPEARDLITQLLQRDPKRRLGARGGALAVKQHAFFARVRWSRVYTDEAVFVPSLDDRCAPRPAPRGAAGRL